MITIAADIPGILLAFLAVIVPVIFVHEGGHYLAGRMFRARVVGFSLGFGRELLGWTDKAGTRWSLRVLPFGASVKFASDADGASLSRPEASAAMTAEAQAGNLALKPVWQRAIIAASGPLANILFAIVIIAGLFMTVGQRYTPPQVAGVVANSPAAAAGFKAGDIILSVNGAAIRSFEQVRRREYVYAGQGTFKVRIARDGATQTLTVRPQPIEGKDQFGNPYRRGRIGVLSGPPALVQRGPLEAFPHAAGATIELSALMAQALKDIITGDRSFQELGGPVTIARSSRQHASLGPAALASFMAIISLNLGLMNLLPVPRLDGGHLLLYVIEAAYGRPISRKAQTCAYLAGLVLLIGLMLSLTWHDLQNLRR